MYFLVALLGALTFLALWLFGKKKELHFEYGAIIFGAAAAMWFIDCVASAIGGEPFLSFEIPTDLWISLWTLVGGLFFYGAILLGKYLIEKKQAK
jgi:hypothetical protein